MNKTITVSSKVSVRVAKQGKDHIIAYTFAKLLSSTVKHPIIFNHRANLTPLRLLIGLSDSTYRKQLNLALELGYCRQEGNHLRLLSRQQEYKLFNIRSSKSYQQINIQEFKQFFQLSVLEDNIKFQQKAIKCKALASKNAGVNSDAKLNPFCKHRINQQITLSVRKTANLLNVSVSNAHNILRNLQGYGLTLIKNRVDITKHDFRLLLNNGSYNVRYDKQNQTYYYIGASLVELVNVFNINNSYTSKGNFYNNDLE